MAAQPVSQSYIPVEEYLSMTFEHDADYIDGVIRERTMGGFEQCFLQGVLSSIFFKHRSDWGVVSLPEQHLRITPTRYLIPDVTVVKAGLPREPRLTKPPLVAIEILSPTDTLRDVVLKGCDYLEFGIQNVRIIDPKARTVHHAKAAGLETVANGWLEVPGTPIRVSLDELFSEMDRA